MKSKVKVNQFGIYFRGIWIYFRRLENWLDGNVIVFWNEVFFFFF